MFKSITTGERISRGRVSTGEPALQLTEGGKEQHGPGAGNTGNERPQDWQIPPVSLATIIGGLKIRTQLEATQHTGRAFKSYRVHISFSLDSIVSDRVKLFW